MSTAEPSRQRKILFIALLSLLLALMLELGSMVVLYAFSGQLFTPATAKAERDQVLFHTQQRSNEAALETQRSPEVALAHDGGDLAPEVVHPFLGYVRDPTFEGARFELSPMGFFETEPPSVADENRVNVGIFGGSVAVGLSRSKRLVEELEASPAFVGKKIWVRSFALGGYKQPQQLIALNYALATGEQLDVVINLDGFNDIALAPGEHADTGLSPYYPRQWQTRVGGLPSASAQRLIGEIAFLEARRSRRSGWCAGAPLAWSPSCHLAWKTLDFTTAQRLAALRGALAEQSTEQRSYLTLGPKKDYASRDLLLDDLTQLWRRSALQMHRLCEAQGIAYFHFLQPNQYLPGSKSLSLAEQREAFHADAPWAKIVPVAYPELSAAGLEMRDEGVEFHDLSGIFEPVEDTIYVDTCCHFNGRGMDLVAETIARAIRDRFEP